MSPSSKKINVYLEMGKKRTFAGAVGWPGWCRSGRDVESVLAALLEYGPRYARVLRPAKLSFHAPKDISSFKVVERLKGGATTDFGAPEKALSADKKPIKDADLRRLEAILKASWRAFDSAVKKAKGRKLSKGPRGGGRELDGIVQHLIDSSLGYLGALGWKVNFDKDRGQDLKQIRASTLEALKAAAAGQISRRGPRGGVRWTAGYFVRRETWHVLDHAWEIEDRIL
jgi:hypothetical protein